MLRRRRLPAELEPVHRAFLDALEPVELARAAAVEAMPTARLPGRPLADAVLEVEDQVARCSELMPGWRHPETEEAWEACSGALDETRRIAERLRTEAPALSFDAMAFALQDLIAPLEAFEAATERFRRLRR